MLILSFLTVTTSNSGSLAVAAAAWRQQLGDGSLAVAAWWRQGRWSGSQWDWTSNDDGNEARMCVKLHVGENKLAGPTEDKQAAREANQKANEEAYYKAHWTANYMAHKVMGCTAPKGWRHRLPQMGHRPRSGAAQSWPRDNNEVRRANQKVNNAANYKAKWKANYEANRGGKAKTPDDVQEAKGAQGKFGLDNELDEAKKAQDNINDYADENGATGNSYDDVGIQTIATRDLAAMKILAENRFVCSTTETRLAWVTQMAKAAPG
jgi:hypothetical protein